MSSTHILIAERLLMIAIAGGFGAVSRYVLSRWVMIVSGGTFPLGTLVVNILGCGLFGFIWGLADSRGLLSDRSRLILLVGFLGAFTTFSSFAHESMVLIKERQWLLACLNVIIQNVAGMAALAAGYYVCRWV